MGVRLLDCTLRDGGHINDSLFGEKVIHGVVQKMFRANVDYIEVGFLRTDMNTSSSDLAIFSSIDEAEAQIPVTEGKTKLVLMAQEDQFDVNCLKDCSEDSRFQMIRVSFHDYDYKEGLAFCKDVIAKGYQCCINPINLTGYDDEGILHLVRETNRLKPVAFTIVDTFGSMHFQDLSRIYYLIENNLDSDIAIGLHLHENLSLSFSLSQSFLNIKNPCRDVIIDGSLYGMGRVPGNLCIELMMDYLNLNYHTEYLVSEALEAIDEFIMSIRQKHPWGYSIAYSLSAKYRAHRTYAEYLLQKGKITIADINTIMEKIADCKKGCYDVKYIESLYREHMDVKVEDAQTLAKLKDQYEGKKICFVAPGESIRETAQLVSQIRERRVDYVFCLNFTEGKIPADGVFYTNQKRYGNDFLNLGSTIVILSSNIRNGIGTACEIVSYARLTDHFGHYSDSSLLMALKFAYLIRCAGVLLAGFDGFAGKEKYYKKGYEREQCYEKDTADIRQLLSLYASRLDISFLTFSEYKEYTCLN